MGVRYLGTNTTLYLRDILGAGDELAGICNRNLEYERNRELIETTTMDGQEVGHVLGLKRGSLTFNNLSLFIEEGDEGYYDELCRQWFEDGVLLYAVVRDEVGTNVRDIAFFAYMESYRIVRNNNEVANFDIVLRQTDYEAGSLCPVVTFESSITEPTVFETSYSFVPSGLVSFYTIKLYLDDVLIETQTKDNDTNPITGVFEGLSQDSSYTVEILPNVGDEVCPYEFNSFSVPCPVFSLDVGTDSVDVNITPDEQITRVFIQLADSISPVNIIDVAIVEAPFPTPFASFTGLDESTNYWARAVIQIYEDPELLYTRSCGWVAFTTGVPYEGNNVIIENDVDGLFIAQVREDGNTFITIEEGSFPVAVAESLEGNHAGFTGAIEVTITGTGSGELVLFVNFVAVQTLPVSGSGTYTFDSATYAVSDIIEINLNVI
jgi:hypothetical protein